MPKIKIATAILLAAGALSAATTTTASANWFTGGTELAAGKTAALATTAKIDGDLRLLLPSASLAILCTATVFAAVGPHIQGGNTAAATSLVFTGCATTEPITGCDLEGSEIPTQPVKATATLGPKSPEDRITFTPATKTLFAEIPFLETEKGCSIEGKVVLAGSFTLGMPTGQSEEALQAIEGLGSVENNSLQFLGQKAFIAATGKTLLKLTSGSKWSFR